MMTSGDGVTVLITGPTSGPQRSLAPELAGWFETDRPDLSARGGRYWSALRL